MHDMFFFSVNMIIVYYLLKITDEFTFFII